MSPRSTKKIRLENRKIDYEAALAKINAHPKLHTFSAAQKREIIDNILLAPYLDLTDDWAFKRVLGHNASLMRILLSDILQEEVDFVQYEHNEIPVLAPDDKQARVDVSCSFKDGRKLIVEMQNIKEKDLFQRLFYYGSSLSASQVVRGGSYLALKPVYVIAFLNFERPHLPEPDADKTVFRYRMLEEESGEPYDENPLTIFTCEMHRLTKGIEEMEDSPVDKWLYILRNCGKFAPEQKEMFGAHYSPLFDCARTQRLTEEELMDYLDSKISDYRAEMIRLAGYDDGFVAGEKQGIEQGLTQGATQERIAIAKAMLAEKMDVGLIVRMTGLSSEEIEALR